MLQRESDLNLLPVIVQRSSNAGESSCKLITFLNPYSYLLARKNIELFKRFDCVHVDGQLLVRLLGVFNIIHLQRKSFDMTSLAPEVFEASIENNQSIYFIGSGSNSIARSMNILHEHYPQLIINGYRSGYFENDKERRDVIVDLVTKSPDIVICGMGTPLQELFLYDLRKSGWNGVGYSCGGFLHQLSKRLVYYPDWVDRYNLRWIYRIYDEPKLFKRYFYWYPVAIAVFFFDYLRFRFARPADG